MDSPVINQSGPSPRMKKWSGGGNHRVPTAREGGGSTRGGPPLSLGGLGVSHEKILNF